MSFGQDFVNQYLGKQVDVDNFPAQKYQCYDLWMQFVRDNYGVKKNIILKPSELAQDIWENFNGLGLDKYFTRVRTPKKGDWAVWDRGGETPLSHVAMFVSDNGNGSMNTFGQNAPTPRSLYTNVTKSNLLGYLRPKGSDMPTKKEVWKDKRNYGVNQDTYIQAIPSGKKAGKVLHPKGEVLDIGEYTEWANGKKFYRTKKQVADKDQRGYGKSKLTRLETGSIKEVLFT